MLSVVLDNNKLITNSSTQDEHLSAGYIWIKSYIGYCINSLKFPSAAATKLLRPAGYDKNQETNKFLRPMKTAEKINVVGFMSGLLDKIFKGY